jgi:iron-sulfur cluster repair protein YtfE (RIC family)
MDVTKMLEADHRAAEQLLKQIKKSEGKERAQLVDELAAALLAHMELEERVLYPKIAVVVGTEEVQEANNEHHLARQALQDVVGMSPDEPGIGAAIDALEAGVAHHIKDEEEDVFPKLRTDGKRQLDEMATPFMQKRMELEMDLSAQTLESSFSKDELAEEAKLAGVDNTSSMKKHDLAEALARKMAS